MKIVVGVLYIQPWALVGCPQDMVGRSQALLGCPQDIVGRPPALVGHPQAL